MANNPEAKKTRPWFIRALLGCAVFALVAAAATGAFARHFRLLLPTDRAALELIRAESWPGPGARILVVAPHPDDETLGGEPVLRAAARGHLPARVILVTCGDGFPRAARRLLGHPPSSADMIHFGRLRQQETLHACRAIGLKDEQVVFLGFPDGGIERLWSENWLPGKPFRSTTTGVDHCPYARAYIPGTPYCGQFLLTQMKAQLLQFKPTDIYVSHPWDDHPDHYATNYFVMAALNALENQPFALQVRVHPYLTHSGRFPLPRGYHPDLYINPPDALRSNGLTWSELRLSQGEVAYRKNIIDLYPSQVGITGPYLERFAARNILFGDVPAFSVRPVLWSLHDEKWSCRDAYYQNTAPPGREAVLRVQAAASPGGILLRIQSTLLARATLCRVLVHPLLQPPGRSGAPIASLGTAPPYLGTHLGLFTADSQGRVNYPGGARYNRGHVINLLVPYSFFSGARRIYLGVTLSHPGHPTLDAPWRAILLD